MSTMTQTQTVHTNHIALKSSKEETRFAEFGDIDPELENSDSVTKLFLLWSKNTVNV